MESNIQDELMIQNKSLIILGLLISVFSLQLMTEKKQKRF